MDEFMQWVIAHWQQLLLGAAITAIVIFIIAAGVAYIGGRMAVKFFNLLFPEEAGEIEASRNKESQLLQQMPGDEWRHARARLRKPGHNRERLLVNQAYQQRLRERMIGDDATHVAHEIDEMDERITEALRRCGHYYALVEEKLEAGASPQEVEDVLPGILEPVHGGGAEGDYTPSGTRLTSPSSPLSGPPTPPSNVTPLRVTPTPP